MSRTLSSFSWLGTALPRPSGLKDRLPEPTALEYSLISRYSGFLYQDNQAGQCILEVGVLGGSDVEARLEDLDESRTVGGGDQMADRGHRARLQASRLPGRCRATGGAGINKGVSNTPPSPETLRPWFLAIRMGSRTTESGPWDQFSLGRAMINKRTGHGRVSCEVAAGRVQPSPPRTGSDVLPSWQSCRLPSPPRSLPSPVRSVYHFIPVACYKQNPMRH